AWGDLSVALHLLAPRLVAYPVLEMGTPEQKERILSHYAGVQFCAGSAAVMEPRMDFDCATLATSAQRQDGSYRLNGSKCFVPLADEAAHLLVYARSGTGEGYQGVDAFLIERGAPGLTIAGREQNMGIKALATHEIILEDCRVSAANRLGGDAGCDFGKLMNYARVGLAALAVGVARAAFEYARDYAKERKAFGVAIAQKQAIAFM